MFHLLLGRARESPAPKLLLVIPSKLDCLKLAKFFRLELKVYCVRLGTKCLDRMDVQQLYPIYWTLRADGKLKTYIFMKSFWTQNVLSWIIITYFRKHPTPFNYKLTYYKNSNNFPHKNSVENPFFFYTFQIKSGMLKYLLDPMFLWRQGCRLLWWQNWQCSTGTQSLVNSIVQRRL